MKRNARFCVDVRSPRGAKRALVEAAIDAFAGLFGLAELERACPAVSRDMVRQVLKELRRKKAVECSGRGPAARWRRLTPSFDLHAILRSAGQHVLQAIDRIRAQVGLTAVVAHLAPAHCARRGRSTCVRSRSASCPAASSRACK